MKRLRNFIFAHRLLSLVLTGAFLIVVLLVVAVLVMAERLAPGLAPGLLEFIAALVSALAWPLAIVVVVLLLRHQISELIPLLRRFRYGELEMEFSEKVVEAAEEIEQRVEETPVEELPALPEDVEEQLRKRTERLRERAQVAPSLDVIEAAWKLVETEAHEAAMRNDVEPAMGAVRIVTTLADRERIPEWVVAPVRDLRRLRSQAARREYLPAQGVIDYVTSVASLIGFLARA
jgi:hypothetical protein